MLAVPLEPLGRRRLRVLDQQRHAGGRRHIDLGAHRADRRDRRDHPLHLGRGGAIDACRATSSGHDAAISKPAPSPAKYCHSSSVMNGMIGCSSCTICAQHPGRRRLRLGARRRVARLAGSAWKIRYTSRRRCPRRTDRAGSPPRRNDRRRATAVTAAAQSASAAAIQRLTVSRARAGENPATGAQPFISRIARRVPQLGGEVAVALDPALGELDVAAGRGQRRQREAQRVAAIAVDQFQRVDDVAARFRHLLAALVAHQRVDVDGAERHLAHEMQPHHHHPGDPEKDDVEAGDQHVARIIAGELRGRLGPAQGRERPQRRRKPGVEHVLVAAQRDRRAVFRLRPRPRASASVSATKTVPSGPYQAGIWCPHHSWREMHQGWMLRIHSKNVFSHCRGTNRVCPSSTAAIAGSASTLGVAVPLVGQPRLDDDARAVVMRHHQGVVFDLFEEPGGVEVGDAPSCAPRTGRGRDRPPAPRR